MNILGTDGISHRYAGNTYASLEGVTVSIRKGVRTVILGANGAGKSTLFYHFNGILRPIAGEVLFEGKGISYRRKAIRTLRSKVSVVLQNPDDQIFGQTVESDVAYGPVNLGLSKDEVGRRVSEALSIVGLEGMGDKGSMRLSYGQKKRLALAGAIAMGPEVLVMDEPTAGLDPQMALEILELMDQLHHRGTTVVVSTHDVDLMYSWADEIHVLRNGRLVYSGDPEGFFSDISEVRLSGLVNPTLFDMNRRFSDMKGCDARPFPKTISQTVSKMAHGDPGRMFLIPVSEGFTKEEHDRAKSVVGNAKVGIFGTVSRKTVHDLRLPVDFVFDGFESCAINCLRGGDSLLMFDYDCRDMVESRLDGLSDFGTAINVIDLT